MQQDTIGEMMNKNLVEEAFKFAKEKHAKQTREDGRLYISHPLEVAARLAKDGENEIVQAAALLHDVPEDCAAGTSTENLLQEIQERFGKEVADLVKWETNDESLPLVDKKLQMIERFKEAPREAKMIKLADRLHNVSSIAGARWKPGRIQRYVEETIKLVEVLREGVKSSMPEEIMAQIQMLAMNDLNR